MTRSKTLSDLVVKATKRFFSPFDEESKERHPTKIRDSIWANMPTDSQFEELDDLFEDLLVHTRSWEKIQNDRPSVVVGDRGVGVSTILTARGRSSYSSYTVTARLDGTETNIGEIIDLVHSKWFRNEIYAQFPSSVVFDLTWSVFFHSICLELIGQTGNTGAVPPSLISFAKIAQEYISNSPFDTGPIEKRSIDLRTRFFSAFSVATDYLDDVSQNLGESGESYANVMLDLKNALLKRHFGEMLETLRRFAFDSKVRFLITVDGLDNLSWKHTAAPKLARAESDQIEYSLLRSLLNAVFEVNEGAQEHPVNVLLNLTVGITSKQYRYLLRNERDSYRISGRCHVVSWSGIELLVFILKRLKIAAYYQTDQSKNPLEQLNDILRHVCPSLPNEIAIEESGGLKETSLFFYVLLNSFWRPKDIWTHYSRLVSQALDGQTALTSKQVQRLVKLNNLEIIEDFFLEGCADEFCNIKRTVGAFAHGPQRLSYKMLLGVLKNARDVETEDNLATKSLDHVIEGLCFCGFLGIVTDETLRRRTGLDSPVAFYYTQRNSFAHALSMISVSSLEYVIHPIFEDFLNLQKKVTEDISPYTYEFLASQEIAITRLG